MIIQWLGHSYFKIETKNKVIAIDPYQEKITHLKPPRFKADLLLITHDHLGHNNKDLILGEPFILEGPGEIEKDGIYIQGIPSYHDNRSGKEHGLNTIFTVESEDITVCHLGDLGEKTLKEDTLEKLTDIDILFIPIGGHSTINAEDAIDIINQIEPKIVIPMHYRLTTQSKLDSLEKFLKIYSKTPEEMSKLTIRKTQLPEETSLIVLTL